MRRRVQRSLGAVGGAPFSEPVHRRNQIARAVAVAAGELGDARHETRTGDGAKLVRFRIMLNVDDIVKQLSLLTLWNDVEQYDPTASLFAIVQGGHPSTNPTNRVLP